LLLATSPTQGKLNRRQQPTVWFSAAPGKTINGTTTNFLYDVLNPVQEKNGGTVTANLLTGLSIDELFTRTDSV
jgi:hypothetical protein